MISLHDYDVDQSSHMPEKPLKEWRDKFEANVLGATELIQFFQKASPFFFSVENPSEYSNLGKLFSNRILVEATFGPRIFFARASKQQTHESPLNWHCKYI